MGTDKLFGKPDRMLGSNLRWTSIPSRGSSNTPIRVMLQKPKSMLSTGSNEPLGLKTLYFYSFSRMSLFESTDFSPRVKNYFPPERHLRF